MSKTPAQLDREIDAALGRSGAPAASGNYYYVVDRGRHRTLYGPYETRKDAAYAAYFHKPVSERDSMPANIFFSRGVQYYDEAEVEMLRDVPGDYDLKSVKLIRRAPPMHASWKESDAEFRQYLRDKDYETAEAIASRRY